MLKTCEPHTSGPPSTGVPGPRRGRASWAGILQVSLVAVPVKAYPATSTTDAIHFNQLHAPCRQRIRYEKHCPIHGKVDPAEIVKGYPYAPDRYVVIEDAELERLRLTRQDWADLARRLPARTRQQPIVPCRKQAVWLEPELYCRVRTLGWTRAGRLRGASFAGLIAR